MIDSWAFANFLKKRKTEKNGQSTHNSLQNPKISVTIEDKDLNEFYKLYEEQIMHRNILGIVEMHKDMKAPILIDLDFRLKVDVNTSPFTDENVKDFIYKVMNISKKYIVFPSNIDIYSLTKPIRFGKKNEHKKDGVHIVIPSLVVSPYIQYKIREDFITENQDYFKKFDFIETDPYQIYDESVINNTGWLMYGSQKEDDTIPWLINTIFHYNVKTEKMTKKVLTEIEKVQCRYIQILSVRNKKNIETVLTKEGEDIDKIKKGSKIKTIPKQIKKKVVSKDTSPSNKISFDNSNIETSSKNENENEDKSIFDDTNPESHEYMDSVVDKDKTNIFCFIESLISKLDKKRADNYTEWMEVGWALKSINDKHLSTWIKFSAQSKKFNFNECERVWKNMQLNNMNTLHIGSIIFWLKKDLCRADYDKINVDYNNLKIKKSKSLDAQDVANVLFMMFTTNFTNKNNVWYEFIDTMHKWIIIEYFHLKHKLIDVSNEYELYLAKLYGKKAYLEEKYDELIKKKEEDLELYLKKYPESKKKEEEKNFEMNDSKRNNVIKKYKFLIEENKEKEKIYLDIISKLQSSSFKENVYRQSLPLFNDKLNDKVRLFDTKVHLIGFRNGVYDLNKMEFRNGQSDDYITFCTNYDYIEKDNEEIQDYIINFVRSITEDEENMEYILKVLAYMLNGEKYLECLWFFTGAGRNGKGTLMTLLKNCLGDYYYEPSVDIVTTKNAPSSTSSASPELVKSKGKRVWVSSEPDEVSSKFSSNKLKLFRGRDKIQGRALYSDCIEFEPQFGMIFQMNKIPDLTSVDNGIANTLKIVHFPYQFVNNPITPRQKQGDYTLKDKFNKVEYFQQFMLILLRYYKKYIYGNQHFYEPESVSTFTKDYIESTNSLSLWVRDYIDYTTDDKYITSGELYNKYFETFDYSNNDRILPNNVFGKEVTALLGRPSVSIKNIGRVYKGICWKNRDFLSLSDDD